MARSLSFEWDGGNPDDRWPPEGGWPYPDGDVDTDAGEVEVADPGSDIDDDLLALHCVGEHVLDGLTPLERAVLAGRCGLDGRPERSMRELQHELGVSRNDLRIALGDALFKVRTRLK